MINENNVMDKDIITTNNSYKLLDNYQYIKPYLSTYNKDDRNCVMCLESYNKLELDNQLLKYNHCGHLYIHEQCLNNWFSTQNKCLLCKEIIIYNEPTQEQQIEPIFQNIAFILNNPHRFYMNNHNIINYENARINQHDDIINYENDTENNIEYINNEVLFIHNELIFHINNTISRRNFYIFTLFLKVLYVIPPIIIICIIFEIDKYFN
jgi:hypothetical protein